jgi:HlyD family secretion protein
VIPEGLLKFENDSAFVEVETDSQVFEKRFVEIGLSDGLNIEVLNGLTFDEKIKAEKVDPKKAKVKTEKTKS